MIQHRGSINNFIINNGYKLKNKQGVAQPHPVLNLKKMCVRFSKQQNNENIYVKKPTAFFVKTPSFLLIRLLFDFNTLIRQKLVKKIFFLYKNTNKKTRGVSKKTSVFIKNTTFVFLPQQTLKQ